MENRKIGLAWAAFLVLGISSQRVRANMLTNGDFESPVVAAYVDVPSGASTIPGWNVLGRDVLVVNTTYSEPSNGMSEFNAQSGSNSLDMTGVGNTGSSDGVSQSINTTAGSIYMVNFWIGAALSSNGSTSYEGTVTDELSINGGPSVPFSSTPVDPGQITWTQGTYEFTATGSSTSIAFYNGTPLTTSEGGLDNVSVTPVPEPVSGGLAALMVTAFLSRRRTR